MAGEESTVTYEELALIEEDLQEVEVEILRQQWNMSKDIYDYRTTVISKIPQFWSKVLQGASSSLDEYFQIEDMTLLEESITSIELSRFEIEEDPKKGDPRSFALKFTFKPNNYLKDKTLEKRFWYRAAKDGWRGYCSEPVKINWKSGKDLTEGLTDAAVKGWQAWQEKLKTDSKAKQDSVPEYEEASDILKRVKNQSFFRFFGYISSRRWVTAEESVEALTADKKRREDAKKASSKEVELPDEDLDDYMQNAEIMPEADDVAAAFADDLYPNALKYYTVAEEIDNLGADSDDFFEDKELDQSDDSDGDEDKPVDIRKLVQNKRRSKSPGPPSKKRKA